jgi:beta-galactosidase
MGKINRRRFVGASAAVLGAAGLRLPMWTQVVAGNLASPAVPLLLGVDYYPDQTPESLWEEDARKISEAGLTNVRIAEFAWALMEPAEGKFDFAWLQRSVDILHRRNIGVILGTPSAAPPPWLTMKYPDVVEVNDKGEKLRPGGRRFTCPTNATYRRLSLAVATEMAKRFAGHPGVIGWQIDNEFTLGSSPRCFCDYCRAGFQAWVRSKYGTLEKVNQTWGTNFWSQRYTDWAQIPVPLPSGADPNPGLALDYDRYQSFANRAFLAEQLGMLRKLCPKHFVTTNNIGVPYDVIDDRELYAKLDFVSFDNYPGFFDMLLHQGGQTGALLSDVIPATIAMQHDFGRSILQKPFLIMEEQSGKAGQPTFSPQPEPGQVRLWSYQAVAHGAMGINYFRWDTATFGAEEYWHGMLNHDRSQSPAFEEILQTVKELTSLGPEFLNSRYEADSALYFDYDCSWAIKIQPGHFRLSYTEQATKWYGAASPSHTGIDLVGPGSDLSPYKIVFAPVVYVISESQADKIRQYVKSGGIFVTSFRLGVKTESSQIVRKPLPGLLADVMGVTLEDYVPIYAQNPQVKFGSMLAGADAECGIWADILKPSSAEVLASYSSGQHSGKPAITLNEFGNGKAVYVGADLRGADLARVLATFVVSAGIKRPIEVPTGIELTVRKSAQKRWLCLLNHKSEPQTINLDGSFKDAIAGQSHRGATEIPGYGVLVLVPAGA